MTVFRSLAASAADGASNATTTTDATASVSFLGVVIVLGSRPQVCGPDHLPSGVGLVRSAGQGPQWPRPETRAPQEGRNDPPKVTSDFSRCLIRRRSARR